MFQDLSGPQFKPVFGGFERGLNSLNSDSGVLNVFSLFNFSLNLKISVSLF